MKTNISQYEIGQWVMLDEGLAQVLHINENYVEKYSHDYFDGLKIGSYVDDILICKVLCDFDGKIRKRNRITAASSKWCEPINNKYKKIVNNIQINNPEEYRAYVIYNDKRDIGGSLSIYFSLPESKIKIITNEIDNISTELPNTFTFKEFMKISKKLNFSLSLSESKGYQSGWGENFSLILFSRLYKTVNKQKVYTRVWYRIH